MPLCSRACPTTNHHPRWVQVGREFEAMPSKLILVSAWWSLTPNPILTLPHWAPPLARVFVPYQPGCSSCEPSSHTPQTHLPPLVPLRCSGGPQTSDDHRCRANSGLQTLGLGWAHPTRRHSPGSSLGRPLVHLFASATSLSGSSCVMTQWRDCLTGWNPPLRSSGSLCKRPMHSESCLHE